MAVEDETERVAVKTTVPAYQKDEWTSHAEELGMSQSEFVRTMVQAGRREVSLDPVEPDSRDATPGDDGLKDRLLEVLATDEHLSWEELLERLSADLEERLEEALTDLQEENRVRYSGRHDGYTVIDP